MIFGLLLAGILTAIGTVLIAAKFSRTFLYKILGYDYAFDIFVTVAFMWLLSGSYSGAMVAIINGICISVVLWMTKNVIGYQKLVLCGERYIWYYYSGTWTMKTFGAFTRRTFITYVKALASFIKGWKSNDTSKLLS